MDSTPIDPLLVLVMKHKLIPNVNPFTTICVQQYTGDSALKDAMSKVLHNAENGKQMESTYSKVWSSMSSLGV